MDEPDGLYAIDCFPTKVHQENLSIEFAKSFSIDDDDDDDDIILLDNESDIIYNEVKNLLNCLLTKIIINEENYLSQIRKYSSSKHSLNIHFDEEEECHLNPKKVRLIPSDENSSTNLFVSEQFQLTKQSQTYTQFLYNLGYDLCLEENLKTNSSLLSNIDKQTLLNYNQIFHQHKIYSCKYCSFQTHTIHVMEYHSRTPHIDNQKKYSCTLCSFRTFRLSVLRRHFQRKHHLILISELSKRRYQCCFCSFETNERNRFFKHNKRCQIEQKRTYEANNLLAPVAEQMKKIIPMKDKSNSKLNKNNLNYSTINTNTNDIIEPILIESDHDSPLSSSSRSLSSDEDFIVSSDDETSSTIEHENTNNHNSTLNSSQSNHPPSLPAHSLSSLSKLLLLNNAPLPTFPLVSINPAKPSLIPIQPKPTHGNDAFQMCHICQCYIFKIDYTKHMNEKHLTTNSSSTPVIILSNPVSNPVTCIKPTLILSKDSTPQIPTTIFLLSTSTMNTQLLSLNMIKCPWCDTNFEHIDIMTGHLMRYHRMTLAAAKVVVAEQMKIQGTSSNQLASAFKQEIELIQNEFKDKTYWKLAQPKIYLHQLENLSCFVCQLNMENLENHFFSSHQIHLSMMNTIKQCCLCGYHCEETNSSLFEHQLRTHKGICYSSVLKQFIRFEPPPPPSSTPVSKQSNRVILRAKSKRRLTTSTEKKFGCRKCDRNNVLFTFEELVEHLRLIHKVHVKLYRRCLFCQQTYLKGNEYNQHCLEHLNDEYPLIKIHRQYFPRK